MYFHSNLKLLRRRGGLTQEELSTKLGIKRPTLNNYENQISQPSLNVQLAVSNFFEITLDVLVKVDLTRFAEHQLVELEREKLSYARGTKLRVLASTVGSDNEENIEVVPVKASAGYLSGFSDPDFIKSLPTYRLPFLKNDRKYRTFQITGDSMLPIPDGTWVTGEFVQDWTAVKTGEACIVLTREDGLVFKIVENLLEQSQTLRLSSLNPLYSPFEVTSPDIQEVWRFVHYTSSQIPSDRVGWEQLLLAMQQVIKEVEEMKRELKSLSPK